LFTRRADVMDQPNQQGIAQVLGRIPGSLYVMTAHHEEQACGMLVSWVQQVAFDPPMIMVALNKGGRIIPMLHDSHAFALCQIAPEDKLVFRKFTYDQETAQEAFEGLETMRAATGSPILTRALTYMDCDLVRHLDIDSDHDLYIGAVRDAKVLRDEQVIVRLRENGFEY
jgi:flavin reductase (DIM6/NTAB) family NADH-FMN oxidoreductase RutF